MPLWAVAYFIDFFMVNFLFVSRYLERIPEDQDKIYYIVCPTRDIAENSPYMEALLQKGVEVLYWYGLPCCDRAVTVL